VGVSGTGSGTDGTVCALQVDVPTRHEQDTHASSLPRLLCETRAVIATVLVSRRHVDLLRTASAACHS